MTWLFSFYYAVDVIVGWDPISVVRGKGFSSQFLGFAFYCMQFVKYFFRFIVFTLLLFWLLFILIFASFFFLSFLFVVSSRIISNVFYHQLSLVFWLIFLIDFPSLLFSIIHIHLPLFYMYFFLIYFFHLFKQLLFLLSSHFLVVYFCFGFRFVN